MHVFGKRMAKIAIVMAVVLSMLSTVVFAGNIDFNFTCYASENDGINFYKTASKKDDNEQTFYCTVKNSNIYTNRGIVFFAGAISKNVNSVVTDYCSTGSNTARLTCDYNVYCEKGQAVYLMGDSDRGNNYVTGIFCA